MKNIMQLFSAVFLMLTGNIVLAQEASFDGWKEVNNTKLYVKIIGEGEPIIFVHGGPGVNHAYFLPHMLPLADSNKLVFYDQRSCGRSATADKIPHMSFENMVQDIEALRDSLGLKQVTIMAHSWGSRLALGYALKYPKYVKSLVLVSPIALNHEYDKVQMSMMKEKTEPQDEIIQDNIVNSEAFKNGETGAYEQLLKLTFKTSFYDKKNLDTLSLGLPDDFVDANKMLMMGMRADMEAYDKDMYPLLTAIKQPVLIIHGDADNIPFEADEKLKSVLPSAKIVRFTSSGHFSFIEENAKFVKTVNTFLHPPKEEKK